MGQAVVVYTSKYGAAKRYADALAEKLRADCLELSSVNKETILAYDVIVYGAGVYAGVIKGFSKLKKWENALREKKLVLFAVGLSPVDNALEQRLRQANFPPSFAKVPLFCLPGALDQERLRGIDKWIIRMVSKADMGGGMSFGKCVDNVDVSLLEPLLAAVQAK